MVLPKIKRHLNEKDALRDNNSIHGHQNLNDTECFVIARHRKFVNLQCPVYFRKEAAAYEIYENKIHTKYSALQW